MFRNVCRQIERDVLFQLNDTERLYNEIITKKKSMGITGETTELKCTMSVDVSKV
jgi:hypothetical protein